MSVPQIVATAAREDYHPPFYYLILHYWMMVFGTSESAVRLLSALFGVLAIPMIYVIGRQLFKKEVGLVAALILALSSFNIQYSQETRMYSLMVLLALFSMYFFLRFLQRSTLASSAGYILCTTLLTYTHLYGFFVVIAQNIYVVTILLMSKRRSYRLRHWVALQAIVFAFFVPWGAVLINQISRREAQVSLVQPPTIATVVYSFFSYTGGRWALFVLFLGLSVLSLFVCQKVQGTMDWKAPLKALKSYSSRVRIQAAVPVCFLAIWLLTVNLIPFIISRISAPIYVGRYTIAASVALYLLVAKGISSINHRYTKVVVIGIIVVLSAANLQVYYTSITKPQGREATALIDANFTSGDVVLVAPSWEHITFDYHNNRTDVAVKPIYFGDSSPIKNPEAVTKELQSAVNSHERVWFYYAKGPLGPPTENFTLNFLNQSFAKIYITSYIGYDVYLYEKRA